jgi:hypothetical protein
VGPRGPADRYVVDWQDIRDAEDLGLVKRDGKRFVVADPIYRELYDVGTGTVNGAGHAIISM